MTEETSVSAEVSTDVSLRSEKQPLAVAMTAGALAFVTGAVVLLGWALDVPVLKGVSTNVATMKANTALGLMMCGAALMLVVHGPKARRVRFSVAVMAAMVITLGGLTLAEHILVWDAGIDQLLFRVSAIPVLAFSPARMAPSAAYWFLLTGIALLMTLRPVASRSRRPVLASLGFTVLVGGGLALLGHVTKSLFEAEWWDYAGVAVPTALAFVLLGSGLLTLAFSQGGGRWSLRWRGTGGFAFSIASVLAVGAVAYHFTNQLKENVALVDRAQDALQDIEQVRSGMANLEAGHRGFIIVGDETLLAERETLQKLIGKSLEALDQLTAGNSAQQRHLAQLKPLITRSAEWQQGTITARRAQDRPSTVQTIDIGTGIALTTEIRRALDEMDTAEYTALAKQQQRAATNATTTFLLLPLGLFLSLTLLTLLVAFLNTELGEREVIEAKLRASEAEFRAAFEQSAVGKAQVDVKSGRYIRVNLKFCVLTGYSAEELVGMTPFDVTFAEDREALAKANGPMFSGETALYEAEKRYVRKDGKIIWVLVTATMLRNAAGRPERTMAVVQDITARKEAEATITRQIRELDALYATTPAGLFHFDANLRYVRVNAWTAAINGRSIEAHIGRTVGEVLNPELAGQFERLIRQIQQTGEPVLELELHGTTIAHVDERDWLASFYPVRGANGEVVGVHGVILDITARKQGEAELRESEKFNRMVLESSPDCVKVLDGAGRLQFMNQNGLCHLEVDDFAKIHGQPWWSVWPEASEDMVRDAVERASGGETVHFQAFGPTAKGTPKWWDVVVAPVQGKKGEDGAPILISVSRDVTAQREAEQAAREQDQRLRSLLENTPLSVVEWNSDLIITRWAGEAVATFGWSAAEVVGSSFADLALIYEEDRHIVESVVARLTDGVTRHLSQSVRLLTKDRRVISCIWHHSVLVDAAGKLVSVLALGEDVTASKEAEEALLFRTNELRESTERYRAATAAVSDLVWTNTADGLMRGEQPGWGDFTGQSRDEYQGYGWSNAVHPDDVQPTLDAWALAVAAQRTFVFEHRVRHRDGAWRVCSARAVPLWNTDGTIREWVGVHTDITERKRDEENLRRLAAQLSEGDRRKDEFLATLAHELRNPLAPIRNGLELMKLAHGQPETVEQARAMMERQLTQMVRLVDDLMDVSRISRGTLELRKERVSITAVVESALESSRLRIDQMGHELTVTLPKQPLLLDADLTRLAQVLLNLLNNAAKYTDRGGHIALTVERQGSDAVIMVKDDGIGIAADELPRIFEMFTQVNQSVGRSEGGLGIGLTLVKRLVELHGGSVEARSEGPGHGSEFVVRLPAVIDTSTPQSSGGDKDMPAHTSLRILVVDDNRDSADSLAVMLRLMGNEVRTAYDGQHGVDEAGVYRPDVIVFDIGLPKLNGYAACRRIREEPWGQSIMLIAMTGWGRDDDRRRAQDAGFDHHVVKPVDARTLMTLIAGAQRATP